MLRGLPQGEGGEQGDALMLDDVYLTSKPDRVGAHPHPFGEDEGVEPSRTETSCV